MSPDWTKRREASVSNPKPTHNERHSAISLIQGEIQRPHQSQGLAYHDHGAKCYEIRRGQIPQDIQLRLLHGRRVKAGHHHPASHGVQR